MNVKGYTTIRTWNNTEDGLRVVQQCLIYTIVKLRTQKENEREMDRENLQFTTNDIAEHL